MFEKEIPVLLVDDEPDVLSISQLAMKGFQVFGLPITLYTAESKAKAIELLESEFAVEAQIGAKLNVAFIDVVMETDTAGLELCDYIRSTLRNKFIQIYIRTGQPGVAPEREVIDKYDINGYFTKVEATEDKLYTLTKSGVRQAYFTGLSLTLGRVLQSLIAAADSREHIAEALRRSWDVWDVDFRIGYSVDGTVIARGMDERAFEELRDRLAQHPGTSLGSGDDEYVVDDKQLYIKVAGDDTTSEVHHVVVGYGPPPEMLIPVIHTFARSFAMLWHKTPSREPVPG
jgi:CheY-like chemotaxis protein